MASAKLSRGNEVAKAMEYMLTCWTAFTRFLDDGRIGRASDAEFRPTLSRFVGFGYRVRQSAPHRCCWLGRGECS